MPFGLAHCLFLCVDESSVKSIQQEHGLAHILAVSVGCGEEPTGDVVDDEEWTGKFAIAISFRTRLAVVSHPIWYGRVLADLGGRRPVCSDGCLDHCGKQTRIGTQEPVTFALLGRRGFNRE